MTLTATATDSDDTVASVEFFKNGQSLGIVTQAPYTKTVTGLETGNDSFTAKATDNLGAATTSAPIQVTVGKGIAKVYYIYSDHLNTPRVITDSSTNNIVWRWDDSDPFGMSQTDSNPSGLRTFTYNQRLPRPIL